MEPFTRFCPDHPGIKARPFRDECPICNRKLVVHGHTYPDGEDIAPHFQADDVKALEPAEEAIVLKRLAELDEPPAPNPSDPGFGPRPGQDAPVRGNPKKAKKEPEPAKSHHKGKY